MENSSLPYLVSPDGVNDTLSGAHDDKMDTERIQLYVVMGIMSFLSAMGTAGNALVLYVFSQKKDKLVSTLFILVLAFVDFITCLIVIPYTIYMEYVDFVVDFDAVCKTYQFLITSNIPFSAMIMVAIAVDRYFCICHPFLRALNIFRAKVMVAALALLAICLGICVSLMYGVYDNLLINVYGNNTNVTGATIMDQLDRGELIHNITKDKGIGPNSFTLEYHSTGMTTQDHIDYVNDTSTLVPTRQIQMVRFFGVCSANELILNTTFIWYFQKFYTALYLVCLIIVIVLYILIYRSVLARRTKRAKQKSKSLPLIQMSSDRTIDTTTEETQLTVATETNGATVTPPPPCVVKNGGMSKAALRAREKELKEREKQRRKSMKKDRNRMANLKTAAMLFVVTVVFIITFCPAFLMANSVIPYNIIVFYMYFANNVANPVIYSFMNKNFRDDLKKLFKC